MSTSVSFTEHVFEVTKHGEGVWRAKSKDWPEIIGTGASKWEAIADAAKQLHHRFPDDGKKMPQVTGRPDEE